MIDIYIYNTQLAYIEEIELEELEYPFPIYLATMRLCDGDILQTYMSEN